MLGSTRRVERILDEVSQHVEIQLRVAGHIRDAVPATDVQFGQYHPMPRADLGHQWDHLADGVAVERRVGHLRTDMALQTDQLEQRMSQYPLDRTGGVPVLRRGAELLVRHPNAELNGLRPTHTGVQKSDL
jgi:hypothetical protein